MLSMGSKEASPRAVFCFLFLFFAGCKCLASEIEATQTATLKVDASPQLARQIPETLFGIFFEVKL
jgi:alpha-L-arabinofuranosidase